MPFEPLHDNTFNPGGLRPLPDARNITVQRLQSEGVMSAPKIDWEKGYDVETSVGFVMPTSNQQNTLSCTGQAWRYYLQMLEYVENKKFTQFLACDIYSQSALPQGGAYTNSGAKIACKSGITPYTFHPDDPAPSETFMRDRSWVTGESVDAALPFKAGSYAIVPSSTNVTAFMEAAAQAILLNNGAITGVDGSNEGWRTSDGFVRPPQPGENVWGHALLAVGFGTKNGKKYIKVKNSWGKEHGDNGYDYLNEDYFAANAVYSFITLVDIPDSILDEAKTMLNVIKDPAKPDLYAVGKDGKKYRIPDEETWRLFQVMGVLPVSPDHVEVTVDVFASYPDGGDLPSKKLIDTLSPIVTDVFRV